jgi:hypothetical protein
VSAVCKAAIEYSTGSLRYLDDQNPWNKFDALVAPLSHSSDMGVSYAATA